MTDAEKTWLAPVGLKRTITHNGGGGDFEVTAAAMTETFDFAASLSPSWALAFFDVLVNQDMAGGGVSSGDIKIGSNIHTPGEWFDSLNWDGTKTNVDMTNLTAASGARVITPVADDGPLFSSIAQLTPKITINADVNLNTLTQLEIRIIIWLWKLDFLDDDGL